MTKRFSVVARVSTDNPRALRPILERLVTTGSVKQTEDPSEFLVEARFEGGSAKELNRSLLSELRRTERRTRVRSEWESEGTTYRFFDYVQKSASKTTGKKG